MHSPKLPVGLEYDMSAGFRELPGVFQDRSLLFLVRVRVAVTVKEAENQTSQPVSQSVGG
jgi:hypothetical protein